MEHVLLHVLPPQYTINADCGRFLMGIALNGLCLDTTLADCGRNLPC